MFLVRIVIIYEAVFKTFVKMGEKITHLYILRESEFSNLHSRGVISFLQDDVNTLSCVEFHEEQVLPEKFSIKHSSWEDKRRKR